MKYKLSEIGRIVTGKTPSTKNKTSFSEEPDKYLFVTPRDMNDPEKTIKETERYLTDEVTNTFKNLVINDKSICVSCIGTIGKVFMPSGPAITNQQINSITEIKNFVLPDYLYYYLTIHQKDIENLAGGTTMPIVNKTSFEQLKVEIPDLETQQKIVRILSALDQKIELNNNESNTLQSIIGTQYRKVFSENENNNKVKASDLFDYEGGYSYTSAELADESDIGMMTIKNFERTGGFKADGFKALSPKKGTFRTAALYDIFISCTDVTQNADIIGNAVMLLDNDKYSTVTYSMDLVRIIPKINRFALYAILSSKDFKSFALGYKSGTTVLHLNKKCLAEYEIALPDEKSLDVFGATIEKACKKIAINLAENRCLSQIRDSLLPKLMSDDINLDKVTDE